MNAAIPILRVKDARTSAVFYCEKLGFSKEWEHQFGPGYPIMMAISMGSLNLFLSEHQGTGTDAADLYVYVEDVDSLQSRFIAAGVSIEQPATDQPWGVRDLQIRDLDRHRFTFATKSL